MKTQTASEILAEFLEYGTIESPALREAMDAHKISTTDREWEQYAENEDGAPPREQKLTELAASILELALDWDWTGVDRDIRAAYGLLNATPPPVRNGNHGYIFHLGEHPIQVAQSALQKI